MRQQAKEISKNILKDVKAEKQRQIEILAEEIKVKDFILPVNNPCNQHHPMILYEVLNLNEYLT